MPPKIFNGMYNHVLTDKGLEIFDKDWESVKKNTVYSPQNSTRHGGDLDALQ